MHHQHLEAGAAAGRRARMQEDPAIGMGLLPASSNRMGSHITHNCCAQRSCSEKLYALRTGRHGGERETAPQPAMSQHRAIGRSIKPPEGSIETKNRLKLLRGHCMGVQPGCTTRRAVLLRFV